MNLYERTGAVSGRGLSRPTTATSSRSAPAVLELETIRDKLDAFNIDVVVTRLRDALAEEEASLLEVVSRLCDKGRSHRSVARECCIKL